MMIKKIFVLLFLSAVFCLSDVMAQVGSAEPTTVSNIVDAVLPWGAQRILPTKVPSEFNALFDKLLAESGDKIAAGRREVLAWEGNYKNRSRVDGIKNELKTNFRKESWTFQTGASEGDVELFGLSNETGVVLGFFVANKELFVCALLEIQKADANPTKTNSRPAVGGSIVGKWFRTTGGSTIDWTGKTTLKGDEDFTFEFFADGTVQYTRKKAILNIMECHINSDDSARGRYSLSGSSLTIDLDVIRSVGTNSCDAKENYNKTLGNSTMKVQIQIKQLDDITRPERPYTMCFDGNEVCYEKQR